MCALVTGVQTCALPILESPSMHHFASTKNRDTAVMSCMLKNVCSVGGIGYRKPPVIGQWYRGDRSSSAGHLLLFVVAARRHMSSTVADLNAEDRKTTRLNSSH